MLEDDPNYYKQEFHVGMWAGAAFTLFVELVIWGGWEFYVLIFK